MRTWLSAYCMHNNTQYFKIPTVLFNATSYDAYYVSNCRLKPLKLKEKLCTTREIFTNITTPSPRFIRSLSSCSVGGYYLLHSCLHNYPYHHDCCCLRHLVEFLVLIVVLNTIIILTLFRYYCYYHCRSSHHNQYFC